MGDLFSQDDNGAELSKDGLYRYRLWRIWDTSLPSLLFVMLNPSTADAEQDDPTIRRCINYAKSWGYGKLTVGNLFALRSTDPTMLYQAPDPIGPENDRILQALHAEASMTLAAWGAHGEYLARGAAVRCVLAPLHCLALTAKGQPRHPLYLPKTLFPIAY